MESLLSIVLYQSIYLEVLVFIPNYIHNKEENNVIALLEPSLCVINHWWYIFTNKYELLDLNIEALYSSSGLPVQEDIIN